MHVLDEIIRSQKNGESKGIPSICSAHPWVLKGSLKTSDSKRVCLIEATCNQVNQYGGYTGMTPADFVRYVQGIAEENHFPFENIILGGDHLGPNVWQDEPASSAMQKSEVLIRDFVQAGFVKIHLDCSMRLGDDPKGAFNPRVSAERTAQLAKIAEAACAQGSVLPRYVIGTEVPIPGGAQEHETGVSVTKVEDAQQTIQVMHEAFQRNGLERAWERVIAVVVQPGVEFGDDFVLEYQPLAARDLSRFIENQTMVYEAHSTDYQTRDSLRKLVKDHFAILKVGPWLTYAYREAVFALALIENELFPISRSNFIEVLDEVMLQRPEYWEKYYHDSEAERAMKRKFSFSDRIRYYWPDPRVQAALSTMMKNLNEKSLPLSLLSRFAPRQYEKIRHGEIVGTPENVILDHIGEVLLDYEAACSSD
ncbi:MAG TPA: D-tagatose-bisphosphate aldolase, class II, non-catalytic subunit [Anaerolineales bacterium]